MINGINAFSYSDLNGLKQANVDDLQVSNTFQNINSTYYNGVKSNLQTQIDNINTAVSTNIPSFSIGTVLSVPYTTNPSVFLTGSITSPILNFILSQGPVGITPQFSIGTILYGNLPTVSISGTIYDPILNFTLSDNSYAQSISGNLSNYITSNNVYVLSLSGLINTNNNNITTVSGNLNTYIISSSGLINTNNTNITTVSGNLSNYITSNNVYVSSLSGSINTISGYLNNSLSGYLYYYNQTVSNANQTASDLAYCENYKNAALGYRNDANTYQRTANDYKNQAWGFRDEAEGFKNSAAASATACAVSVAACAASVGLASSAGAIAGASSGASSGAAAGSEAAATLYENRIEDLESKTLYQSTYPTVGVPTTHTSFTSTLEVSNGGISPVVQLNPNSQSYFHQGINCPVASTFGANIQTNGINNTNGIQNSGGIISDSLSIDSGKLSMKTISGLNQISYKSGGPTDLRDCAIEFYQPSPLTLTSDTGTMNLRAFNINIGNANQTSLVYINGTCYFYNPINMSGYINQFP